MEDSKNTKKLELFEYIVFKLIKWYKEDKDFLYNPKDFYQDSSYKFISPILNRFHFFVCALSTQMYDEGNDLLNIFDNFHSNAYGSFESDVQEQLKDMKRFESSHVDPRLKIIFPMESDRYSSLMGWTVIEESFERDHWHMKVDEVVEELKSINKDIIGYDRHQLSRINKFFICWKISYGLWEHKGIGIPSIPPSIIRKESDIKSILSTRFSK